MSEIRNLTRNGETFFPLTCTDAIVNRNGDLGVDDMPLRGSDNLVKSDGIVNKVYSNNPIGSKGYIFCEIGGFDTQGVLNNQGNRARVISKNISKISLSGQTGIKFAVFGNDNGINSPVTAVTSGWTELDFTNNTSYTYLFVMVSPNSGSNFTESPILYVEFSDYHEISTVSDSIDYNNLKPISSRVVFEELNENIEGVHNWVEVKENTDYTIITGYYLNNVGASLSISASFFVSEFIDATNINAVRYTGLQGPSMCNCAWYSNNNETSVIESKVYPKQLNTTTTLQYEKPVGAKYLRISSKYQYISYYKFEFSIEEPLKDSINNRLIINPIKRMKRITLIIIYGQSLSIGEDGATISSTPYQYNNTALMFSQGVKARVAAGNLIDLIPLVESGSETPARGLAESFIESLMQENLFDRNSDMWNERQLILSCPGVGGATIDELTNNTYYQYVENIITAAKNYCVANGYVLDIPVWCWLQGEQDIKVSMSSSTYKEKLIALQNKVCNSIQTITGITTRPKCIVYQPNCQSLYKTGSSGTNDQFDFNYDHMGVQTAFMELVRDNDEFIASVPTYIFDPCPVTGGYWVHLSGESYKLLGAMLGYNIKKYIINGISNKGIVPTSITVNNNTIKIKYNVPCPPLTFDTDYVRKAPNMGFNVIKLNNSDIINSVSLFNDTVTLECTESPIGCKLRYGMNGDFMILSETNYRGVSGREHGSRGNLRDNQGNYIYKDILNIKYPLHNWAYTFELQLQ